MLEFDTLTVQQEVEHFEVFTGLETKNRYRVLNPSGERILFAYEQSSFLARQFLRSHRPLTISVVGEDGKPYLTAKRKFFWFFSNLQLFDGQDQPLGRVKRRFGILRRRFNIRDASDQIAATIEGPIFRPNTFRVKQRDQEVARVTKRWSGLLREVATKADTFQVEYLETSLPESLRWLILGSAFSIDLDFFESGGGGASFGIGR